MEIARTPGGKSSLVDNADNQGSNEISSHASVDSDDSDTAWDETIIYTKGTLDSETNVVISTAAGDANWQNFTSQDPQN